MHADMKGCVSQSNFQALSQLSDACASVLKKNSIPTKLSAESWKVFAAKNTDCAAALDNSAHLTHEKCLNNDQAVTDARQLAQAMHEKAKECVIKNAFVPGSTDAPVK